jgi:MFS family permease
MTTESLRAPARDITGQVLQFLSTVAGLWKPILGFFGYLGLALAGLLGWAVIAVPAAVRGTTRSWLESLGFARDRDSKAAAWRVLKHPEFCRFFIANIISNWGTWLQNTAQMLIAYKLTHSLFTVGAVTGVQFAAPLIFGPWAGVVADRVGARRTLIITQVGSAVITGIMAILEITHSLTEIALFLGALAVGLMFTFALPAQSALIPALFREDTTDGKSAMVMNSVAYNAGRMVAPVCTVLIVLTAGFWCVFALNAITFAIFANIVYKVKPVSPVPISKTSRVRDGLRIAREDRRVLILLLCVASVTLAEDPILVLGPGLARHAFHISYDCSGYFLCALGGGAVLSSLLPRRRSPSTRRPAAALGLLGVSIVTFALAPWMWLSVAAAFSAGFWGLVAGSAAQTMLRRLAGKERALQVMGLWAVAWAGSKPFASLIDGLLPSLTNVRITGVIMAIPALLPPLVLILMPNLARRVIYNRPSQTPQEPQRNLLVTEPSGEPIAA